MRELAHQQSPGSGLRELALFAGAGGGILGGKLLGWRTVGAVELDPYARAVLAARQNDGCLAPFPIWDDVRTFDGRPWRGIVDVVSGGFPCTDISIAGKGAGIDGAESGLWREMARIIGEVRPAFVLVENSPALTFRGGLRVVGDLAAMGYDARWGIISAADAIWLGGTPCIDHLRDRIWIAAARADANSGWRGSDLARWNDANWQTTGRLESDRELRTVRESVSAESGADSDCLRELQPEGIEQIERGRAGDSGFEGADATGHGRGARVVSERNGETFPVFGGGCAPGSDPGSLHGEGIVGEITDKNIWAQQGERSAGSQNHAVGWWSAEPDVGRVAPGIPSRVDRLRCIGMSQVPAVVRLAWETLKP